jgi:hypothetical protein
MSTSHLHPMSSHTQALDAVYCTATMEYLPKLHQRVKFVFNNQTTKDQNKQHRDSIKFAPIPNSFEILL